MGVEVINSSGLCVETKCHRLSDGDVSIPVGVLNGVGEAFGLDDRAAPDGADFVSNGEFHSPVVDGKVAGIGDGRLSGESTAPIALDGEGNVGVEFTVSEFEVKLGVASAPIGGISVAGPVSKVDVAGGEEYFASGIDSLPDDVEDVVAGALWEFYVEAVEVAVADVVFWPLQRHEIIPLQGLIGAPPFLGQKGEEVAWIVRDVSVVDHRVGPGIDGSCGPIAAGEVEARVFIPSGTGEGAIGNHGPIGGEITAVVIGDEKTDFVPIVECLGAGGRDSGGRDFAFRILGILEEDTIGTTDRVSHRTVSENEAGNAEAGYSRESDSEPMGSGGISHRASFR